MSDPWFNPNLYAWIPGTMLGVVGGVLGSLAGTLAPAGKARRLVIGAFWGVLGLSAVLLAISVAAFISGQPYGVWYGLGLPGVIGLIVFGPLLPTVYLRYRQAEERRMAAKDGLG